MKIGRSIAVVISVIFAFLMWLGEYTIKQDKKRVAEHIRLLQNSGPIPDLGVVPQKEPTKFLKFDSRENKCLSKKEFYEGMEDAEMKGMADDPSAQDIYDEFNR